MKYGLEQLADVMSDPDKDQEVIETIPNKRSSLRNRKVEDGDSEDMVIREEIDDDEPTFYNDSTKIELQLQETSGHQGLEENGYGIQEKMKRFVSL